MSTKQVPDPFFRAKNAGSYTCMTKKCVTQYKQRNGCQTVKMYEE